MSTQHADEPQECELSPADFEDLPSSAKLVLESLHNTDGRTTREMANDICISERTIRYALTRLDDKGIIESRYLLSNPQTCQYRLMLNDERLDNLLNS